MYYQNDELAVQYYNHQTVPINTLHKSALTIFCNTQTCMTRDYHFSDLGWT